MFGRVGDSPIIGAGTYANNLTCAVSCTGDGEYFIRSVVAYNISAMMELKKMPLAEAAQTALDKAAKLGGTGGLIALDKNGNFAMPFNTSGMYRGRVDADGKISVEIYQVEAGISVLTALPQSAEAKLGRQLQEQAGREERAYSTISSVAFCPCRAAALERSARIARIVCPLRPMIRPISVCRICKRKTVRRPFGISESMTSSGNSTSCRMMNSRNCRTLSILAT